jgi:release factor-specific protein-(glutamine-N5) methyltransferase
LRHRLYERAASGRRAPTEPEKRLWGVLRNRSLNGHKFRRQTVIGKRIVDFFCPSKGLIVEIDGVTHNRDADAVRDTAMMREHGFTTVRFTNDEVMQNLPGVVEALSIALVEAPDRWTTHDTTPHPPPLEAQLFRRDNRRGSVAQALRDAVVRLGTDWARDEAEMLMAHALGISRSAMLLGHLRDPSPAEFDTMLARRMVDEPVAYILGGTEFYGRRFQVTPDVLIPRADSEATLMAALEAAPVPLRILDCGTGSGCLLLSLLAERPEAHGIGIDRSPAALTVAGKNAAELGVAARTELREGDWSVAGWADDLGSFDLIVANPPYVEETADLDASVRDFEPAGALFAGPEGLDDYRVLVPQLPALLAPGGVAVLEIGHTQAASVTMLAEAAGFTAELRRDLAGRDRALILRIKDLASAH